MKIHSYRVRKIVELSNIPFEENYLTNTYCRKKGVVTSSLLYDNQCSAVKQAFEEGLLKDLALSGLIPKDKIKLIKIKEYVTSKAFSGNQFDAGYMELSLVYKAFMEEKQMYIACQNNIVFPKLVRHVSSNKFKELSLFPYLFSVNVWANDNFRELIQGATDGVDQFYFNKTVDEELYQGALFLLQLYSLDNEHNRCVMHIEDGSFFQRYPIILEDLESRNYSGMYSLRKFLGKTLKSKGRK